MGCCTLITTVLPSRRFFPLRWTERSRLARGRAIQRPGIPRKGGPRHVDATGLRARPALLVRGSSRRITTMTASRAAGQPIVEGRLGLTFAVDVLERR